MTFKKTISQTSSFPQDLFYQMHNEENGEEEGK